MTGQTVLLLPVCLCCMVLFAQQQNDVNVAPNKSYTQSTTYRTQGPSSMGANGNTSQYFPANCIHTLDYYNNPWWQVDLGRTYPVQRIDVWSRHNFKNWLYPSTITVDDQRCASINDYPTDSRKKEVTCSSVMYGQRVRITRQGNYKPLAMCEMQIWVPSEVSQCEVGKYGSGCSSDCSSYCGKGQGKNFCYKSNGYCYDGCVDGWYRDQCSIPCSPGCQNTACDRQSGQCSCTTGYEGSTCTECQYGYYKTSRACQRCSTNCWSQTCDKSTGKCKGCVDGRYGDLCTSFCLTPNCQQCDQDTGMVCSNCTVNSFLLPPACTGCVDGRYGDLCTSFCLTPNCQQCDQNTGMVCSNCAVNSFLLPPACTDCRDGYFKRTDNSRCQKCSAICRSGTVCDKITGYCSMCPPGKKGNLCTEECPAGWYGENCAHECGSCLGGVACNKTNGHCRCSKGKQAPYCQTDCQGGRYGQDCAQRCGQCRGGQTCDPVTGHCSSGCQPGWMDPMPSLNINLCESECKAGRYGDNCTQPCGHCLDSHLYGHCNPATGVCPYKCQKGWKMPLCQQEGSDEDDKETVNTYAVVGSVIAGAVIIGVCIMLGIILKRRSGKTRQNENASIDTDLNTSPTTFRRRAQGEREKTTTDLQAAQEQEQHYEIAEETTMGTSSVHLQPSTSSDVQHGQSEADSANPYDQLKVQYSNTGDVQLYDRWYGHKSTQ